MTKKTLGLLVLATAGLLTACVGPSSSNPSSTTSSGEPTTSETTTSDPGSSSSSTTSETPVEEYLVTVEGTGFTHAFDGEHADGSYEEGDQVTITLTLEASKKLVDIKPGNAMPLSVMPIGTTIHNIESKPGAGARVARSAGLFAQLAGKDDGYAIVRLQSGETRMFLLDCLATVGTVSNPDKKNEKLGKAGRNRWLGVRPSVRGESMNPVDHPHGGRTRGGRIPVSPTGVCARGGRTRLKSKPSNRFIVKSRHKK